MNWHELWLWLWYGLGALLYMVKRAFYGIQPPNPVAHDVPHYIRRAGIPILFRFALESAGFWTLFNPVIAAKVVTLFGGGRYVWLVQIIAQFAPAAFVTGLALDPMADWFIPTVIGRIPGLKDWWPQMPGPLPQPVKVEAQIVTQTTEVQQLQTKTTVLNPQEGKQ